MATDFDNEVDESLRRARLLLLWRRYGVYGMAAAALVIVFVGANALYQAYSNDKSKRLGDLLTEALRHEADDDFEGALIGHRQVLEDGEGTGYELVSAFRVAQIESELQEQSASESEGARPFSVLASRGDIEAGIASFARFADFWSQLNSMEPATLERSLSPFLAEAHPMRPLALEALILSYYSRGDEEAALRFARDFSEAGVRSEIDYVALIEGGVVAFVEAEDAQESTSDTMSDSDLNFVLPAPSDHSDVETALPEALLPQSVPVEAKEAQENPALAPSPDGEATPDGLSE